MQQLIRAALDHEPDAKRTLTMLHVHGLARPHAAAAVVADVDVRRSTNNVAAPRPVDAQRV